MTDAKVVICAILGLVVIEVCALFNGINGTLLRWMIIAIAGLGGLMIPQPTIFKRS